MVSSFNFFQNWSPAPFIFPFIKEGQKKKSNSLYLKNKKTKHKPTHVPFLFSFVTVSVFPLFRIGQQISHGHVHSWSVLLPFFIIMNYFHIAMNYLSYLFSFILNIIKQKYQSTVIPQEQQSPKRWQHPCLQCYTALCYDPGHHKKI